MEPPQRQPRKDGNINIGGQVDRLSSLPDSLLVTILSLLPIHSAAATSVLSHRWRHLWTHITHLSFRFPKNKPRLDDYEYMITTINHILSQLNSPNNIHTFDLPFSYKQSNNLRNAATRVFSFLDPWIRQICARNPEVLKVDWPSQSPIFQIPTCVLETSSLVSIILRANVEFVGPTNVGIPSVNLPYLKELHLYLNDSHRYLMDFLFKSLPLLEDLILRLKFTENGCCIQISAPNLKSLSMEFIESADDCECVINAPKLEHFHIQGFLEYYEFVENPINLLAAYISIESDCHHDNDLTGLVHGISFVRSLVLRDYAGYLLDYLCELEGNDVPVFHNLMHLSYSSYEPASIGNQLPGYLLGNLRRLEIDELMGDDNEIELLQHTLSNASQLGQLHVSVCSDVPDQLQTEYEFCKKIFLFPRSSLSCRIQFSGTMISASSSDLRNGRLTCQLLLE